MFEVDDRMRWVEFRPVLRGATRAYQRRVAAEGSALMVDADLVRRLLAMLEQYRALLVVDPPDPYRRRHLVQTRMI